METRGFHQLVFTGLFSSGNDSCQLTGRSQPASGCTGVQECRRLAGLGKSEPMGWDHRVGAVGCPGGLLAPTP